MDHNGNGHHRSAFQPVEHACDQRRPRHVPLPALSGPGLFYGNVAEIEFDSHGVKLTGTGSGTAGPYKNDGNTFFDAPAPGYGDYVGIDQGH